jgi:hypothetical protein
MTHVPSKFALCLLAAAISAGVHAQQANTMSAQNEAEEEAKALDAVTLDAVIVTGNRTPKAVDKIPGAITVVSAAEVQHTLLLTEDATAVLARNVPGYAESSQAMSNSGETLRGRIALRLFDGIPQGSPLREGTRNGTFTDMGIVGRIEVINGPSASEGIGAAGGIINYLSKDPTVEGHETTLISRYSTQFGSDSAGWKLGVNHAYKGENADFIGGISFIDRGISYDGDGRRVEQCLGALRPFHEHHHAVFSTQLVETKRQHLVCCVQAVEITVYHPHRRRCVLMDQCECRAGDRDAHAESAADRLHERRLPGPEITAQRHQRRSAERTTDRHAMRLQLTERQRL